MESQSMIYIVSEYASQGEIFGECLGAFTESMLAVPSRCYVLMYVHAIGFESDTKSIERQLNHVSSLRFLARTGIM